MINRHKHKCLHGEKGKQTDELTLKKSFDKNIQHCSLQKEDSPYYTGHHA